MRRKPTPEDQRHELVEAIRRTSGLMESVLHLAQRAGRPAPIEVVACVPMWRTWGRRLANQTDEPS